MRKITAAVVSAAVAGALALTGCGSTPDDHRGDAGKVVERDSDHWTTKSGKTTVHHWDYDLTIKRSSDGTEYELDVTESGYDHCYRGSSYPKCVDR